MKLEFAVLARTTMMSSDETFTIIGGGFEKIKAASFPHLFTFSLFARLTETNESLPLWVTLDVIDPHGQSVLPVPFSGPMRKLPRVPEQALTPDNTSNVFLNLAGIPLAVPGEYKITFEFSSDSGKVGKAFKVIAEESITGEAGNVDVLIPTK